MISLESYESLIQFLYQTPIGLVQTKMDGTVELLNPMSARLLMPLSHDGGLDNLFDTLDSVAPQLRGLVAAFQPLSGAVCESLRVKIARPGGRAAPQVLSISLMKLGPDQLMTVLSDATLVEQREEQVLARKLNDVAHMDSLTQMPNRAAALERLQQVLARSSGEGAEFAVLFLNGDRFRQVNDTLGHAAGNEVISLIAERLRSTLRAQSRESGRPEQLAARTGGDEFVVVLDGLRRADDVHAVAQRLIDVLAKPYGIGKQQVHLSFSMGVLLRPQSGNDAGAVLQDASIAMVEAKREGGGRYVVFEPQMQEAAARRGTMESELRTALVTDQLFVVYQPVVGLQSPDGLDRGAGVEALVRWRHPVRGIVSPGDFIPVAEETGLICPVGDFVLATACHQFVAWQETLGAMAPRAVAVNLSRAQLRQPGFVSRVRGILRDSGMNARHLQLEVTETLAAQDESVKAQLHELKTLGLTLALDDFGTGYSSLSSLHQLPVDTVKIDRSFVSQADTSLHHRVLIEAMVQVAHSLGMSTVAEGMETGAQAAVVRNMGCEKGQGYFYSRPLVPADVAAWLADAQDPGAVVVPRKVRA